MISVGLNACKLRSLGILEDQKLLKAQDTLFSLVFSLCLGGLMGGGELVFTPSTSDIYFG